jgi:hypothetical protein
MANKVVLIGNLGRSDTARSCHLDRRTRAGRALPQEENAFLAPYGGAAAATPGHAHAESGRGPLLADHPPGLGATLWLTRRTHAERILQWAWPLCIVLMGTVLLFYVEG